MKKEKIYEKAKVFIAGPYTQGEPIVNVSHALEAGEFVLQAGGIPVIPHLCHFWHFKHPHSYDEWMEISFHWLRGCSILYRLVGESRGAYLEARLAEKIGIQVCHSRVDVAQAIGRYNDIIKGSAVEK